MRNICFISYRRPGNEKASRLIQKLADALEARICINVAGSKVFLDQDRLKLGDALQSKLGEELCGSACMIVLYNRSYFDLNHHFCAREYHAMVQIERRRSAINPDVLRNKGLILTLAVRDPDHVPAEIREQRVFVDASRLLLHERAFDEGPWIRKLDEIAAVVADRHWAQQQIPDIENHDCSSFCLPTFEEVEPWLRKIVAGREPQPMPGH